MTCKYTGEKCPGLTGCHVCPRNPNPVMRVRYPTNERVEYVWDTRRLLKWLA